MRDLSQGFEFIGCTFKVHEVSAHLFHVQSKKQFTNSEDRWGGIPRYLVDKTSEAEQSKLQLAIQQSDLHLVIQSFNGLNVLPDVSHKLVHIVADKKTLNKTGTAWASVYVQQQTILQACEKESFAVKTFIKSAGGIPEIAGYRGTIFEALCHSRLMKGGLFTVRDLDKNESETVQFPCLLGKFEIFDDLSEIMKEPNHKYWRPASKSLPAIDALVQPNILHHVTVSGHHEISANGLLGALDVLSEPDHARIYFVLPEGNYKTFTRQPIQGLQGLSEEAKERLKSVRQFALKIDVLS